MKLAITKLKIGRPTIYTPALAREICNTIACSTKGTKKLCEVHSNWPSQDTLFAWLKTYSDFSEQYSLAKMRQAESLVDEIVEIADHCLAKENLNKSGGNFSKQELINQAKLKIDTRKWLASTLAPKVYGNQIDSTSTCKITINHEEALNLLKL